MGSSLLLTAAVVLVLVGRSALCHGGHGRSHFMEVQVSSLLPQEMDAICNSSPKVHSKGGVTLQVVHRHGPCSPVNPTSKINHSESLRLDQVRVDSIHARLSGLAEEKLGLPTKSATLASKPGSTIGSPNYIVSVGLGTPKRDLSLVFDTGSGLTWTQCEPCAKSCYKQVDPIFNPAATSTYSNVSCTSAPCAELAAATGIIPSCSKSSATCVYGIQYGDTSYSVGYLAKERLALTPSDYVDGFVFGCGQANVGLFGGSAGLLGLSRDSLSAVSQLAPKYGKYFSYCLPPSRSSTGHLTFGKGGTKAKAFSYTPLVQSPKAKSFYFLELQSILVGGSRLPVSPTIFSSAGSIIDSGTVITRLPPTAYSALSAAFKKYMSKYPAAPAVSILDTCFDLSKYQVVSIPKVSLVFRGEGRLDLPLSGILFPFKASQVCLAFAGNDVDTSVAIIGNTQQHSFDVVYDVDGGRLGFGPMGC